MDGWRLVIKVCEIGKLGWLILYLFKNYKILNIFMLEEIGWVVLEKKFKGY